MRYIKGMKVLFYIIVFLCVSVHAEKITGTVINVHDGDTVSVKSGTRQVKIRMFGIDAPELVQPFGRESKMFLLKKILHKKVEVKVEGIDNFKRTLGTVYLNRQNINLWMIKNGYAWHYDFFNKSKIYAGAEKEARKQKAGLWKDDNPQKPYLFRKQNRRK